MEKIDNTTPQQEQSNLNNSEQEIIDQPTYKEKVDAPIKYFEWNEEYENEAKELLAIDSTVQDDQFYDKLEL